MYFCEYSYTSLVSTKSLATILLHKKGRVRVGGWQYFPGKAAACVTHAWQMGLQRGTRQQGEEHVGCSAWRSCLGSAEEELWVSCCRRTGLFFCLLRLRLDTIQMAWNAHTRPRGIYRYNVVFGNLNTIKINL